MWPPSSLMRDGSMRIRFLCALIGSFLCALLPSSSFGHKIAIPTPFEIGPTRSGNYLSAIIAGEERDVVAASAFFQEVARQDPQNLSLQQKAFVAALSNGNIQETFQISDHLLALEPKNELAHLALTIRAMKGKRWYEARSHIQRAGSSSDLTTLLLSAWIFAGMKETRQAFEMLDMIREPRLKFIRDYHAGLIADLMGKTEEARKRLKSAYEANPSILRIADNYARFLSRHGEKVLAKNIYEKLESSSTSGKILASLALKDLAANRSLSPLIPQVDMGAGEALFNIGILVSAQEDTDLVSVMYLQLALHLFPQQDQALMALAELYDQMKQEERAIDIYENVPISSPFRLQADIQIGLLLEAIDKKDLALSHLLVLKETYPHQLNIFENLGHLYRSRKDFSHAVDMYTRAIELSQTHKSEESWSLYYFRGICYERLKKWPLAEADLRHALSLAKDHPLVLNYLGYSLVDQGLNVEEAFQMLQKAVELRPNDGYIVDSLAWAYYRLGRYEEALKYAERAIQLRPSDSAINDHLGDIYWRLGRKLEAQFQWNHARDLNPEPEDLSKILDKIKDGLKEEPSQPQGKAL